LSDYLRGELTDDEERARDACIGTLGWPRSSSFGPASRWTEPLRGRL